MGVAATHVPTAETVDEMAVERTVERKESSVEEDTKASEQDTKASEHAAVAAAAQYVVMLRV